MDRIYTTTGDAGKTVVYDLKVDGAGEDLSAAAIEAQLTSILGGVAVVTATVTADPDQGTYPGRVSTEFGATELAVAAPR